MPLYNRLKEYRARLGVNQQEMGRGGGGGRPHHNHQQPGGGEPPPENQPELAQK